MEVELKTMMPIFAHNKTNYVIGLILVTLFLFGIRIYGLQDAPLFDYDAVKNYMLAEQVASFQFSDIFYHGSPTLNLLNGFLLLLLKDYVLLEYVHAAMNVSALLIFGHYVSKKLHWDNLEFFSFLLLAGTSLTMVNTSRYLAMESLSLLLFVVFIRAYIETFYQTNKKLFIPGLILGFLFTVNYKAFLILPVIFLIECLVYRKDFIQRCTSGLLSFGIPFLCYVILSFFISTYPLKYPAILFAIMFIPDDHPYKDINFFNTDVFYYIKYLFWYESPVLILVLFSLPFLYFKKIFSFRREVHFELILGIIVYAFICGMSILQKAPRGLLFIYPFLYLFLILVIKHFVTYRKYLMVSIVLVLVLFHLWSIQKNIYTYAHTNYPSLNTYLVKHDIRRVASYIGNGAYPYVEKQVKEFKVLHQQKELSSLKANGISYLLVDDCYRLACMELTIPSTYQLMYEADEQSLLSPLLSLELSEYSGLSFEESLQIRAHVISSPTHLKLYRIITYE